MGQLRLTVDAFVLFRLQVSNRCNKSLHPITEANHSYMKRICVDLYRTGVLRTSDAFQ